MYVTFNTFCRYLIKHYKKLSDLFYLMQTYVGQIYFFIPEIRQQASYFETAASDDWHPLILLHPYRHPVHEHFPYFSEIVTV